MTRKAVVVRLVLLVVLSVVGIVVTLYLVKGGFSGGNNNIIVESSVNGVSLNSWDRKRMSELWMDITGEVKKIDTNQLSIQNGLVVYRPSKLTIRIVEPKSGILSQEKVGGPFYMADGYSVYPAIENTVLEIYGPGLDYSAEQNIETLNQTINMRLLKATRYIQMIEKERTLDWRDKVVKEMINYKKPSMWVLRFK